MEIDSQTQALIQKIYLSASRADRWAEFLEALRLVMDAHSTILSFVDRDRPNLRVMSSAGFDREGLRLYHEEFVATDPFLAKLHEYGPRPGRVDLIQDQMSEEDLVKTTFYADFAKRYNYIGGIGAIIYADGRLFAALGANRHPGRYFGEKEVELFSVLLPHIRTALQIHRQVHEDNALGAAALGALNQMRTAIFLCRTDAMVLHHNHAASELIESHIVSIRAGRLTARSASESERLWEAIADVIDRGVTGQPTEPPSVTWRSAPEQPRLTGIVSYIPDDPPGIPCEPIVSVQLFDPKELPPNAAAILKEVFALAPAEARLALLLLSGLSVAECAERLGTSVQTNRTQLKGLLQKTGTRRQAELIRELLASLPRR